jgi:hypothetical protein
VTTGRGRLYVIGGLRLVKGMRDYTRATSADDPVSNNCANLAPLPTNKTGTGASKVFLNGQPRIELVGGIRPGNNLQYLP